MSKEYEIRQAMHIVWRNLQDCHTTFGPCSTDGCDGDWRGCGPCIKCAQKKLASLTSEEYAGIYVRYVENLRRCESDIMELFA